MAASPRSDIVNPHEIGVYHCWTRCVRRTRLCGVDPLTGKDFSYRRDWIISFQQECATLFAIELAFHAILANHNHNIIRNRPDIAATWTPEEVVRRWLTITHLVKSKDGKPQEFTEEDIAAEMSDPERVEELRVRLADPSVYMASINEHIARRCNREDGVTGHFWEGRFECRNLVDEAAILVCGIYVDLNQIRAGEATTPENSQYTSAYCRIQAFQQQQQEASPTVAEADADAAAADAAVVANSNEPAATTAQLADAWLCELTLDESSNGDTAYDLQSKSGLRPSDRGILPISFTKYLELLDATGRMVLEKKGSIPSHLAPILERLGINTELWGEMVQDFDTMFGKVVGAAATVAERAAATGRRWFQGQPNCRAAFG